MNAPITKTVCSAGTPEVLANAGTYCQSAILVGNKAARTINAGVVYLGTSSANNAQGIPIQPGEVYELSAPPGRTVDLGQWYLDVTIDADGLFIEYW